MPENEIFPREFDPLDGLRRLAFAPANDAVRLLAQINELDADSISGLDLFCVSEIKQNKEGMLEIKFYDRLKALELLSAHMRAGSGDSAASSFYVALESAAKSACDADEI